MKIIAWKSYDEKLLSTLSAQDRNSFSQADSVSSVPRLIGTDMIRKSISKMKHGKAAGLSSIVLKMAKAAGEVGVDMIIDLISRIIYSFP